MGALMCLLVLPVVNKGASAVTVTTNPNGQGDLVIVGDSLLEGSTVFGNLSSRVTALRVWTSVGIDYKRGRRTSEAYGVVRSRLTAARNPTALVIALGTNDMISHSEPSWPARVINRMMTEANGLPVLWVNTTFNGAVHPDWRLRAVRFNRALRAAQKDWSNLFVADWFGYFVPKGPSRFIADGIHLSDSFLRVALRAKGAERTVLVTDAIAAAMCEPGDYALGDVLVTLKEDGRVVMRGGDRLAGSSLRMDRAVEKLLSMGWSMPEAFATASTNPARIGRVSGRLRGIAPGARADLIKFTFDQGRITILETYLSGERVF